VVRGVEGLMKYGLCFTAFSVAYDIMYNTQCATTEAIIEFDLPYGFHCLKVSIPAPYQSNSAHYPPNSSQHT